MNDYPTELDRVYNYFFSNYIRGLRSTRYPIGLCNYYEPFIIDSVVRTNNVIKGEFHTDNNILNIQVIFNKSNLKVKKLRLCGQNKVWDTRPQSSCYKEKSLWQDGNKCWEFHQSS